MGKLNRHLFKSNRVTEKPKINKNDPDWYWHLIEGGDDCCYICGKPIKGKPHKFIGYHKLTGDKLKRHEYCEPGSSRYIEKFHGYIDKFLKNVKPPAENKK